MKEHACYSNCSSRGHTDVTLGIYIVGEARQATFRLNCSGQFTRAIFNHSEVFEKMTDEWQSLLVPGDKIVPIIAFGRGFLVELPPRSSWLRQETSEILPSDGVTWTAHSVKAGRVLECFRIP
jgi:hypothetical protein